MEAKKSPKADLENKKGLFLEIGLVVILVVTLVAFNLKNYDNEKVDVSQRTAMDEIEDVVIQTAEDTPPPPPPEQPEVVTELTIVEDDAVIENELGIVDMSEKTAVNEEVVQVQVVVEEEKEEAEEEIFTVVENDPEFPGGMDALYKYLSSNIKYPAIAKENNITGRVYVTFVVEKDGSIANPRILRDIGGGCGQEAIRVVKSMPKWTPGKQRGKAVRVQFNLPVSFNLQ